jgi:hypothetical protein
MVEMVSADLFGYEVRARRKPFGFQGLATLEPGKSAISRRDAQTASICGVEPLDRATSPAFPLLLASHRRLPRHFNHINGS